jgi:hypothetical protein
MSRRLAAPVAVAVVLAVTLAVVTLLSASGRAAGQEADAVLVGAGDIASCRSNGDEATAKLLADILTVNPNGTVATLGDNAYDDGTLVEYQDCYDPTWGDYYSRTMPSLGNHEYNTGDASGYFKYFETRPVAPDKGYYSYDRGPWHVVVLNSNCDKVGVGGCGAGSPQEVWLRNDLANTTNKQCTLAYFHHPRFSSSGVGNNSAMGPFWKALYEAGAEVVLNGHAHNYERFAPQDSNGNADPDYGISEFIVGTGGKSLNSFGTTKENSEVRLNSAPGVIKLTLHPEGYEWEFVAVDGTVDGKTIDPGSGTCHGAPSSTTDTTPPTVTNTVPASGSLGVARASDVTATFSEDMLVSEDPLVSSITDKTFKLFKKGTTTKIAAKVSYDPTTRTATLDPFGSSTTLLARGTTYKAVVTTGAKDVAGNQLDQSPTTGLQQKAWTFTVSN